MTTQSLERFPPRRTQRGRRAEAEARLVQAAIELIAEKGVQGLVLSEVGERAGYSRGLPAHYFGSRIALIVTTAQRTVEGFADRVEAHLHGSSGLPAVLRFVADYLGNAQDDPVSARALLIVSTEATINPELGRPLRELNDRTVARIARAIEEGQSAGEIRRDVDATAQARLVLAAARSSVAQWLTEPDQVDLTALRCALLAVLERGLAP
ncbi:TetR/AcrR family transcriptional regulator [Pseudonocardia spinosispora]|uniref:TetR/AcrR family transcriptional regulator n=1 Tax=Pseudonocardia spinosispora TaxID=103441 RepID=UPI000562907C|nr:TetR/AcrR family transcriptional regulator [Pseudonocardia spinosispora]